MIAWVLAIVGTLIILKVTDLLVGLRVSEDQKFTASTSRSTARKDTISNPEQAHSNGRLEAMTKIEAIIQPSRFESVKEALHRNRHRKA